MSAPEMLPPINVLKDPRRYYNQQVDIWTLGCLIFNMVSGVPPWYNDNTQHNSEVYEKIRAGLWREKLNDYRENPTTNLLDILEQCFNIDANERINSGAIINHAFFQAENSKYKLIDSKIVFEVFKALLNA